MNDIELLKQKRLGKHGFEFNIEPATASMLASSATKLIGGGLESIGASKANKEEMEQRRREMEETARMDRLDRLQNQGQFERSAGMQGLQFLANQREQARGNSRFRMFRNQLLGRPNG